MKNSHNINYIPSISSFGLLGSILFLVLTFIGRSLYPFGDEPDFVVRAPELINSPHPAWSPYFYIESILDKLSYISSCSIDAAPLSLTFNINSSTCTETVEQILFRIIIVVFITFPLIFLVTFRKISYNFFSMFSKKIEPYTWNNSLDALTLTLLFPGTIYYLGVLSTEQFVIMLSFFIFIFKNNFFILSSFILIILSLDPGNATVMIIFLMTNFFIAKAFKKFGSKKTIATTFITIFVIYLLGPELLNYSSEIPFLLDKSQAMINVLEKGLADKYPIVLRPFITFMSMIFFTPNYIKIITAYLAVLIFFIVAAIKYKKIASDEKKFSTSMPALLAALFTISLFVFAAPNYVNAKYYLFTLPVFINFFFNIFNKKNILSFCLFLNFLVFFQLFIAYLE